MWLFVVFVTVFLSYLIVKIIDFTYFWKKRGIPYLTPWPIVGSFKDVVLRKRNLTYIVEDLYKTYPNKRYYGIHQFNAPTLVVKDLDLIKQITVKDFDHFVDHLSLSDKDVEPLFGKNLVSLKGQKWKDMRATLSPSFTGNKIRIMFTLMSECAKRFNEHFLNQEEEIVEMEMKELMGRFANDVIATCAFGVKCDSVKDKDSIFYKMGSSVTKPTGVMWIKAIFQVLLPTVTKKLKISIFSSEVTTFFYDAIKETLRLREENNIVRPDMIQILMEAMKGQDVNDDSKDVDAGFAAVDDSFHTNSKPVHAHKEQLTVDDIVAQAFVFFLAGFETVATVLAHCLHELAVNPELQRKLQKEIDQELEKCEGDPSYKTIAKMRYLDMVISETLRKWPPAASLNRVCVKDYLIGANQTYGEDSFLLEKGLGILIPVYGIQRDPKYYPEPEKFDPERFNEENVHDIVPYSYIPFGVGPRNCIGSRFALLEVKTLLTHMLSKFDVVPTSKTENPLKLAPELTTSCPKGFWLGLKKR